MSSVFPDWSCHDFADVLRLLLCVWRLRLQTTPAAETLAILLIHMLHIRILFYWPTRQEHSIPYNMLTHRPNRMLLQLPVFLVLQHAPQRSTSAYICSLYMRCLQHVNRGNFLLYWRHRQHNLALVLLADTMHDLDYVASHVSTEKGSAPEANWRA